MKKLTKTKIIISSTAGVVLVIMVAFLNFTINLEKIQYYNLPSLNFFLLVHVGEGGNDDCSFENVDILSNPFQMSRYENCRDSLIGLSEAVRFAGFKATFQFHGGMLKLLHEDKNFSFYEHIISLGHEIGLHHHSECLLSVDEGCEEQPDSIDWGKIGPLDARRQVETTVMESLIRFKSLYNMSIGLGIPTTNYCGWGSIGTIREEYNVSKKLFTSTLEDNGYQVITSSGEFSIDLKNNECEIEYNDDQIINIHPYRIASTDMVYVDSHASLWGGENYNQDKEIDALGKVFKCIQSRTREDEYRGQIFTWGMGTHLHNVMEGNGVADVVEQLSDLQSAIKVKSWSTKVNVQHKTLSEIYHQTGDLSDYEFTLLP